MRIFCYGRKSVYSDKSDSIDNQLRMCRDYCDQRFKVDAWTTFTDEDVSGATTSRPGLQRMLKLIRQDAVDILVVYQLDRLSRSVRDFSNLYSEMEEHNVQFVSLKEQIDTTTPIGRAMMYVTVVFAQMERETIAQRVTDNLTGLAKKGWWVGGQAPIGYQRQRVTDEAGRRHVILTPDASRQSYVEGLFSDYKNAGYMISRVETKYKREGRRTPSGGFFSSTQIYQTLHNPVYATADLATRQYLDDLGCQIVDSPAEWTGQAGVAVYGRTSEKSGKHQMTEPSAWIVCAGRHPPIIQSSLWLDAQLHFGRQKFEKVPKYPPALLIGVARCRCGTRLRVSHKHYYDKTGHDNHVTYYVCNKKSRQGSAYCDTHQIRTELLDEAVLDKLRQIEADPKLIREYAAEPVVRNPVPDREQLRRDAAAVRDKIQRLTDQLEDLAGSPAARHVITKIEELDGRLRNLERQQADAEAKARERRQEEKTLEQKAAEINHLIHGLDGFSAEEKNRILREIVVACTWDGQTLTLKL